MGWWIGAISGGVLGMLIYFIYAKIKGSSRFIQFVPCSSDITQMSALIDDYLKKNDYLPTNYKGEVGVYANGNYKYIKIIPQESGFNVEAFVTELGGRESNLEGFLGLMAKAPCKKVVNSLISYIQSNPQLDKNINVDSSDNETL